LKLYNLTVIVYKGTALRHTQLWLILVKVQLRADFRCSLFLYSITKTQKDIFKLSRCQSAMTDKLCCLPACLTALLHTKALDIYIHIYVCVCVCVCVCMYIYVCLFLSQQPPVGHGLLILDVSRSHTTTNHIR